MASTTATTDSYPSNLPLTPRDSDNEEPGEPSQMAGRKRSASEMEDDPGKTKITTTEGTAAEAPETIEAEVSPDFIMECPAHPKRAKAAAAGDDAWYIDRDAPSLAPNLSIQFAVTPGKKWKELNRFKNAKFNDPFIVIYSAGQTIYVNRHIPVPPSPAADATEEERLQYDKENFWVGLISEFRAENPEKVYVRVFWLYWPEELPMGRQSYHGKRELVLSNHADIIEAQTIASHAEISHWDENDDSNKTVLQERYWRQTFDLKKLATDPRNALSKLRKFCICGGYDNPGVDMYQCHKSGCGMWNHEGCLLADLEERAWENFKKGDLIHEEENKSFTKKVSERIEQLVEIGLGKGEVQDEAQSGTISTAKGNKKAKSTPGGKKPWAGKLKAQIAKGQNLGEEGAHQAFVTQFVPTASSKATPQFEPKEWNMKLSCLKCRQPLN